MITFDGKRFNPLSNPKFWCQYEPARDSYSLAIISDEVGQRMRVTAVQFQIESLDPAVMHPVDPIQLKQDEAQKLMDALWRSGIRPSSGEDHPAHIQALHTNLKDLRTILFYNLGIDKP